MFCALLSNEFFNIGNAGHIKIYIGYGRCTRMLQIINYQIYIETMLVLVVALPEYWTELN